MAKIPMGNFGNALPEVQQTHLPQNNLSDLGQAVGNASRVIAQKAQQQDQEQRQNEVANKVAELNNNQLAEQKAQLHVDDAYSTQFSDAYADIKNRVGNGVISAQDANAELTQKSDEIFKTLEPNIPDAFKQTMRDSWNSSVNKSRSSFAPLQIKADEQMQLTNLSDASQIYGRYQDQEQGRQRFDSYVDKLNISEAQKAESKTKFRATQEYNGVQRSITDATTLQDPNALTTIESTLSDKTYLTEEQTQGIRKQILSVKTSIQNKLDAQENRRISESGKVLNDFKTQVMSGLPLDDTYIANVKTAVAGTPNEGEFGLYNAHYDKIQQFSNLSAPDQLKQINEFEQQVQSTKTSNPADIKKLLGVYQSIYDQKKKQNETDPNQSAQSKGLEVKPTTAMDLRMNPSNFIGNVVHNGINLVSMQKTDGTIKMLPIGPADLPNAKQEWEAKTPVQKLDFIGQLINQTKGVTGGNKVWGAVLGQLGNKDNIYVSAGVAKMNNLHSTDGIDVATSIIRGHALQQSKNFYLPKEDDLRSAFNTYVGQTVQGTASDQQYAVFKSLYADLANESGTVHTKDSTPDEEVLNSALALSTGGIYTQSGSFTRALGGKSSDWKVAKPYGMEDQIFENRIEQGYGRLADKFNQPASYFRNNYRLRMTDRKDKTGARLYELLNSRDQVAYQIGL